VYDTLLFLHILSAAIAFVTVVMFSAWALGATATRPGFAVADMAWNISGFGLTVFGIWLVLYIDSYELWDGWILGALVLFGLASWFGARAREEIATRLPGATEPSTAAQVTMWHWLRTASVVGILILMVWKPGA
jgi:hypothetical protein